MDLSHLREKLNTSPLSTEDHSRHPTPLATFLLIYTKAEKECYIDYMEGARRLVKFLSPISIPCYPESYRVPALLSGYSTYEVAKILLPGNPAVEGIQSYLTRLEVVERAICFCMIEEVLPAISINLSLQGKAES
ncbi:MAG: hypothetical protein COB66_01390 [Coxiella sp. (in: Bacteria)]|nr:MAG: hypothetical protein COB66_01390 [Coxiella sp. (in: g-proteobacteria)]